MSSLNVYEKNKVIFFLCDCKSEVLVIEYDNELELADFAIYENHAAYGHKLSLWQRIRYCYQVLVRQKPYADQIILTQGQLKELKAFLNTLPS
jgi:hypothetical protein